MPTDWTQLATLLPSVVAGLKGSGAETAAFMEGYQRTTQMLEQQRMQQQSVDEAGRRTDLAASEQEYRHGQDALRNKQGALDTLLNALPSLASTAQPAVTGSETLNTPIGPVGVPTMQSPESGVMAQIQSLAGLLDQPDLAPALAPMVKPAITRAEAARQNRRRAAIRDAYDRAVSKSGVDPQTLWETNPDVPVDVDGAITTIPFRTLREQAGMPAVKPTPKAVETSAIYREYQDAKREGYAGTFQQYQNEDANRRRPVTTINTGADVAPSPADPLSQNILSQTGLNINAFRYLTGQAQQLPRDAATRQKAARDAEAWARAHDVDISTLASQYKTYNDVLASNIDRLNKTQIMESELEGTIDNLKQVASDKDLGKLRVANVLKVWAGQEVNDPLAQQYALHLGQLRNELAAYYAATQGRSGASILQSDQRDAEMIIRDGLSTGSLDGLATAIKNSTAKMGTVMNASVDRARRAVWGLFGVGGNYKDKTSLPPPGVPDMVSSVLKGQKDGRYTLTDGSVWIVQNGQITKGQ